SGVTMQPVPRSFQAHRPVLDEAWPAQPPGSPRCDPKQNFRLPLELEILTNRRCAPALVSFTVCRAIMRSSSVGITHAETRLSALVMQGPPAVFARESNSMPSQAAFLQTCSRTEAECSPIPAVKTNTSNPPRAATKEPSSRPMRYTNSWMASAACGSLLADSLRI